MFPVDLFVGGSWVGQFFSHKRLEFLFSWRINRVYAPLWCKGWVTVFTTYGNKKNRHDLWVGFLIKTSDLLNCLLFSSCEALHQTGILHLKELTLLEDTLVFLLHFWRCEWSFRETGDSSWVQIDDFGDDYMLGWVFRSVVWEFYQMG